MRRSRKRTPITEFYSPKMVSTLQAVTCPHQTPRGALYCPQCRHEYMTRSGRWGTSRPALDPSALTEPLPEADQ